MLPTSLQYLCFECPACRYDGVGRWGLVIEQVRDQYQIICGLCDTITLSHFDGVMWVSHVTGFRKLDDRCKDVRTGERV